VDNLVERLKPSRADLRPFLTISNVCIKFRQISQTPDFFYISFTFRTHWLISCVVIGETRRYYGLSHYCHVPCEQPAAPAAFVVQSIERSRRGTSRLIFRRPRHPPRNALSDGADWRRVIDRQKDWKTAGGEFEFAQRRPIAYTATM